MSDSNPASPRGWGRNPQANRSSSQSVDDFSRVEDLGEVEGESYDAGEQEGPGNESDEKEKKGKRRSGERRKDSGGSHKKPPAASAHDEYQKSPAYVAPISKIPPVPAVGGVDNSATSSSSPSNHNDSSYNIPLSHRPTYPRWVTENLIGKKIDEYGDVVDEDGKVLGRVAGDLPSMVGRTVLNQRGDVLGDDGELLGYVAEVATDKKGKEKEKDDDDVDSEDDASEDGEDQGAKKSPPSPPKSIDQFIGRPSASLQVDHRGNILDSYGNIIGHFRDTLKDPKPEEAEAAGGGEAKNKKKQAGPEPEGTGSGPRTAGAQQQTGSGDRPNAASWRKEDDSPSDIFLDVKSTRDGIQLTIRIPTVFNGGAEPRVNFS